jgi:hypothetical protein
VAELKRRHADILKPFSATQKTFKVKKNLRWKSGENADQKFRMKEVLSSDILMSL